MSIGGAAAAAFGPFLGIGPGRGIALIFLLAGVLSVLAGLAAAAFAPLRRLDDAAAGPLPLEPAARPFPVHELEEVES